MLSGQLAVFKFDIQLQVGFIIMVISTDIEDAT